MVEVDKELSLALQHRKIHENLEFTPEIFARDAEEIDIKKRKKARYEMMKRITKKVRIISLFTENARSTNPQQKLARKKKRTSNWCSCTETSAASLSFFCLFIRDKKDLITVKLKENFARIHKIYPSFGVPVFFEYVFHNPYNEEHVFTISTEDPELTYWSIALF